MLMLVLSSVVSSTASLSQHSSSPEKYHQILANSQGNLERKEENGAPPELMEAAESKTESSRFLKPNFHVDDDDQVMELIPLIPKVLPRYSQIQRRFYLKRIAILQRRIFIFIPSLVTYFFQQQ